MQKIILIREIEQEGQDIVLDRTAVSKVAFLNSDFLTPGIHPPTNLSAEAGDTEVFLNWSPSTSEIDSYTVYVFNTLSQQLEQVIEGIQLAEADVMGLTNDVEYEFWIVAVKGNIISEPSNRVSATPIQLQPEPPTNVAVEVVDTSVIAEGGEILEADGYRYHTFKESGTLEVFQEVEVDLYIIAGGGSGGGCPAGSPTTWMSGGGGAGGRLKVDSVTLTPGIYPVIVGAGGIGVAGQQGQNGEDSSFNGEYTAIGGGGGGMGGDNTDAPATRGQDGGSGGGGGSNGSGGTSGNWRGGSGVSGQGFNGANGSSGTFGRGGGGGGAGGSISSTSIHGGEGANVLTEWGEEFANQYAYDGQLAGGGGGRIRNGGTGIGYGGGGNGDTSNANGKNAQPNSGSGGGGLQATSGPARRGGHGGSGIVSIRYII